MKRSRSGVPLAGVVNVHINATRVFAVLESGEVYYWGHANGTTPGNLVQGDVSVPQRVSFANGAALGDVAEVDSQGSVFCARTKAGSVYCWGSVPSTSGNSSVVPLQVVTQDGPLTGIVALAARGGRVCSGLASDGKVWNWSFYLTAYPVAGSAFDGAAMQNAIGLGSGSDHACALGSDGLVACWGDGLYGRLGNGRLTEGFLAGAGRVLIAEGTALAGVTKLAVGNYHTCALLPAGKVACWGRNDKGQLGNGATQDRAYATEVQDSSGAALQGAAELWVSDTQSCVRLASGALHCWGANEAGQLGDATFQSRSRATPVAFPFTSPVTGVALGQGHACTNHGGKEVACWGAGSFGQNGSYSSVNRPAFVTWY